MKYSDAPVVRFTLQAWQKIWALTHASEIEFSAMGVVATEEERLAENIKEPFYVLDIFPVKQVNSGVSTELDPSAMGDLMIELHNAGYAPKQLCFWWHSHVNMGTSHSGTDESQIENFDFDTACISMITNKRNEVNLRIDIRRPCKWTWEACKWAIDSVVVIPDTWGKDALAQFVTKRAPERIDVKSYGSPGYGTGSYGGYGHSEIWKKWGAAASPGYVKDSRSAAGGAKDQAGTFRGVSKNDPLFDEDRFMSYGKPPEAVAGKVEALSRTGDLAKLDEHANLGCTLLEVTWLRGLKSADDTMDMFCRLLEQKITVAEIEAELLKAYGDSLTALGVDIKRILQHSQEAVADEVPTPKDTQKVPIVKEEAEAEAAATGDTPPALPPPPAEVVVPATPATPATKTKGAD